jgi:drug/metabolite transporter (DMT)-like permease
VLLAEAAASCLWIYAISMLPAADAGFGTLLIPMIGVVAAWVQLGERPLPAEALGMVLIFATLTIIALRGALVERQGGPVAPPPP